MNGRGNSSPPRRLPLGGAVAAGRTLHRRDTHFVGEGLAAGKAVVGADRVLLLGILGCFQSTAQEDRDGIPLARVRAAFPDAEGAIAVQPADVEIVAGVLRTHQVPDVLVLLAASGLETQGDVPV